MYENFGKGAVEPTVLTNPIYLCFFAFISTIIVTLLIMFTAFLSSKIDGKVNWNWASVFSPLFIVDIIILIILLYQACHSPDDESMEKEERKEKKNSNFWPFMYRTFKFLLFSIFHVLLALRLDENIKDWVSVWIPIFILEGFLFIEILIECRAHFQTISGCGLFFKLLKLFIFWGCRVLQEVFIALRSDRIVMWEWSTVAIPIILALSLNFIIGCIEDRVIISSLQDENQKSQMKSASQGKECCQIILGVLFFSFLGMLIVHLDNGYRTASIILIPIFIFLSFICLCCCCCLPCVYCMISLSSDDQENQFGVPFSQHQQVSLTLPLLEPGPDNIQKWTVDD